MAGKANTLRMQNRTLSISPISQSVSKILMMNMLLYVLYLISFTGLAVWTTIDKHHLTDGSSARIKEEQMAGWLALYVVTSIFTGIVLFREIGQALSEGVK